jgi:hypothetical protein
LLSQFKALLPAAAASAPTVQELQLQSSSSSSSSSTTSQPSAAMKVVVDHMYKVYQKWKEDHSTKGGNAAATTSSAAAIGKEKKKAAIMTSPPMGMIDSAEPFQYMLDAFSITHQSALCMKVLQDWHAVSGNIALNPPPMAYDIMIQALAYDPSPPTIDTLPMTLEVIAVLERDHYSTNTLPNYQTYANVVRVIAKCHQQQQHQQEGEEEEIQKNSEQEEKEESSSQSPSAEMAKLMQRYTDKFFQKLNPNWQDAKRFEALVHVLQHAMLLMEDGIDHVHVMEYYEQLMLLLDRDLRSMWLSLDESVYSILEPTVWLLLNRLVDNNNNPDTAFLASALVLRLFEMDLHSGLPSGRHFLKAIQAWQRTTTKHPKPEAMAEQRLLLDKMTELHTKAHLANFHSDDDAATLSLNHLMQAYLDAGYPSKVKELWDDNQDRRIYEKRRIKRNTQTFTILLQALAAKRHADDPDNTPMAKKERAQQANSLLQKTLAAECPIFDVNEHHFASVMMAWSRSHDPHAAEYCQQVYEQMLTRHMVPMHMHYHALILTWGYSRLPDAPRRVTETFDAMQRHAFYELSPQILSPVFFAYSKTDPQRTRHLFEQLQDESLNTDCFNAVAMSNPDIAEHVFQRQWRAFQHSDYSDDQYRPDHVTYMARVKASPAPEFVLNECEEHAALGHVEPPTASLFTEVMRKYGERGDCQMAGRMFERMKDSFHNGNALAKPDAHAVTTLLRAIAWSNLPDKVERCQAVLNQMESEFEAGDVTMKPTTYTYGSILSACSNSNEPKASDVAFTIFEKVDNPNEHIFRYLFLVIVRKIHGKQKELMAQMVLQRCCAAGYLTEPIIRLIKNNVPKLYNSMLDSKKRLSVPDAWIRHVKTSSSAPQR